MSEIAYTFVESYRLTTDDFEYWMSNHVASGGNMTTHEVACAYVNAFEETVAKWIPAADLPSCDDIDDSFYEIARDQPELAPFDNAVRTYLIDLCFTRHEINSQTKSIGLGLFVCAAILSLTSSFWFYWKRKERLVKAASTRMSQIIFYSCIVLSFQCFLATRKREAWVCKTTEWVSDAALMAVLITFVAKNVRLEKIFLLK
ncbi:MAG: hypothetical protein MHM6MM_008997, partial [Cercozoa sp. M6MM]